MIDLALPRRTHARRSPQPDLARTEDEAASGPAPWFLASYQGNMHNGRAEMTSHLLRISAFGLAATLLVACETPSAPQAESDFGEFQAEQDQRQELEGGGRRR